MESSIVAKSSRIDVPKQNHAMRWTRERKGKVRYARGSVTAPARKALQTNSWIEVDTRFEFAELLDDAALGLL